MTYSVVYFSLFYIICDKELEVIQMLLIYKKIKLKDLSQGSRIAFAKQFRLMIQDNVSDKLGLR